MPAISEELHQFLQRQVSSIGQLEIILLLTRDPSRSWTASEVSSQIGCAPESAAMRLFLLASQGLIVFEPSGTPRYRYDASGPNHVVLEELAAVYASAPQSVKDLVEKPDAADPIRTFADAFKLKK